MRWQHSYGCNVCECKYVVPAAVFLCVTSHPRVYISFRALPGVSRIFLSYTCKKKPVWSLPENKRSSAIDWRDLFYQSWELFLVFYILLEQFNPHVLSKVPEKIFLRQGRGIQRHARFLTRNQRRGSAIGTQCSATKSFHQTPAIGYDSYTERSACRVPGACADSAGWGVCGCYLCDMWKHAAWLLYVTVVLHHSLHTLLLCTLYTLYCYCWTIKEHSIIYITYRKLLFANTPVFHAYFLFSMEARHSRPTRCRLPPAPDDTVGHSI